MTKPLLPQFHLLFQSPVLRRTPTHTHRPLHHHNSKPNLTAGHHQSSSVSLFLPRPRELSSKVFRAAVFVSSFQPPFETRRSCSVSPSSRKRSLPSPSPPTLNDPSYVRDGKVGKGITKVEMTVKLQSGYVTTWNNLGDAFENKKGYKATLKAFEEVLLFDPNNKIAWPRRDASKDQVEMCKGVPIKSKKK
ncbi:hypothetical protein PIB30_069487 [Stylosanthes scabra]|uniref:Uncharacterized protein n=1 Tax=Stylosanthes scabra TaxID=79078 RepID=A0ABU6QMR3_9FABA|nr:hypothetical protein [Stylosanthes scabra]